MLLLNRLSSKRRMRCELDDACAAAAVAQDFCMTNWFAGGLGGEKGKGIASEQHKNSA